VLNLDTDFKLKAKADKKAKQKKEKQAKVKAPPQEALFQQTMGSVPYGLPCLAVTRRTAVSSEAIIATENINTKLCSIFRAPGDFVAFDDSENSQDESSSAEDSDELEKAYMRLFKRN